MKKKKIIIIFISILVFIISILVGYNYYRVLNAKIIVVAKPIKYIEDNQITG